MRVRRSALFQSISKHHRAPIADLNQVIHLMHLRAQMEDLNQVLHLMHLRAQMEDLYLVLLLQDCFITFQTIIYLCLHFKIKLKSLIY